MFFYFFFFFFILYIPMRCVTFVVVQILQNNSPAFYSDTFCFCFMRVVGNKKQIFFICAFLVCVLSFRPFLVVYKIFIYIICVVSCILCERFRFFVSLFHYQFVCLILLRVHIHIMMNFSSFFFVTSSFYLLCMVCHAIKVSNRIFV